MKKVVIGLSGGVDSSVAALLLLKQGYEVIGITLKTLKDFDTTDASNIAAYLGIEHHIIDISDEFQKEIIDEFIKDYQNGLTPNPCVLCNKLIKFKYLFEYLEKYQADYIATGHYAKIIDNKIYKSDDLNKDQSYFLCQINKSIIPKIIFPLEGLNKDNIRTIAEENNLLNAHKKDSYDICFIKDNFKNFVKENIKTVKGSIVDIKTNEVIGKHNGLEYYTIGQRKGLNLGGLKNKCYVAQKDLQNNILYVASETDNQYLYSSQAIITNFNSLTDDLYEECTCKFRYHQEDIPCKVKYLNNSQIIVKYNKILAVTPGQFCVLYKDNICLGGGTIKEIQK